MSKSAPDPEKLRALGERLDEVRRREAGAKAQPPPTPFGIAFRFSTELVLALVVGAAIGWGLDWLFGTRPILIVVMGMFGAAAGIRNVIRAAKELNARSAGETPPPAAPDDEGND